MSFVIQKMVRDLEDTRYQEENRKSSKFYKNLLLILILPFSWVAIPSLVMVLGENWQMIKQKLKCRKIWQKLEKYE